MGSTTLRIGFVALSLLIGVGFIAAVGVGTDRVEGNRPAAARAARFAALGTALWIGLTWLVARAGLLRFTPFPPTMPILMVLIVVLAIGLGRSEAGRRIALGLPLSVLVGFQGFRIV